MEILLAAEILLDEKTRVEYDAIYRNHFGIPPKTKPQTKPGDRKQQAWKSTKPVDTIVCPRCGRRNVNPRNNVCMYCEAALDGAHDATMKCPNCGRANRTTGRNYCMFCGAGIGPNPRPFVIDDNLASLYSQILNNKPESRFSDAFDQRALQFISLFLVLAFVKIISDKTNVPVFLLAIILLLFCVPFYFWWRKKNVKE